jgi:hypothetical protein
VPDSLDRVFARTVERAGIWLIMSRLPKSMQIVATILAIVYLWWSHSHQLGSVFIINRGGQTKRVWRLLLHRQPR